VAVGSSEADAVGEAGLGDDVAVDGQPKRKRSRRGSRGGRKRRKPSANGDQSGHDTAEEPGVVAIDEAGTSFESEPVTAAGAAPDMDTLEKDAPEYVPMSEWIGDFGQRK
jgi:hypothetical protein